MLISNENTIIRNGSLGSILYASPAMIPAGEINNKRNTCKIEYIFARLASSMELATADSKYGLAIRTPAAENIKLIMIGVKLLPFVMTKMILAIIDSENPIII